MAFQFKGFSAPNGTFVPDEVFDILAPELSEAELRVLLYIIRRTFGFKKNADDISLKQMEEGIKKKDGTVLDKGTGMSKSAIWRGTKGLLEKGVIDARRNRSPEKGDLATTYSLRFKNAEDSPRKEGPNNQGNQGQGSEQKQGAAPDEASAESPREGEHIQSTPGADTVFSKRTPPSSPEEHRGVLEENTQETVLQQTDFNLSNIRKQHAAKNQNPEASEQGNEAAVPASAPPPALEPIGSVLLRIRPHQPASTETPEEARDAIRAYLKDIAPKFNDQAPLKSSVSRAYNLYEAANLPLGEFLSRLLSVSSAVREQRSKVKKRANGVKVTMPYYFACLEDELGLRRKPAGNHADWSRTRMRYRSKQREVGENAHISPASASSLAGEQGGKSQLPHTHSFAHGWPHAQSGQSSVDARSASQADIDLLVLLPVPTDVGTDQHTRER